MKRILLCATISLIVLSAFMLSTPQILANPDITWTDTTALPMALASHTSVAYDGRIYLLGGYAGYGIGHDTVYYCDVNPNGTIDVWHSTTSLPDDRYQTVALVYDGHVYLLGGGAMPGPTWQSEVWRAEIQPDGSLGSWEDTTSLPRGLGGHGAFEWKGRLYVLGGWTGYDFRRETYFAEVQPDGSLGSWISTSLLPAARGHGISAIAHNGYAYALGGQAPDLDAKADVWYAKINSDGTLGQWTPTTSMVVGLETHVVAIIDNEVYVIGGVTNPNIMGTQTSAVYKALINPDGTLGPWRGDTDLALPISIEPRGHLYNQAPVVNNRIYITGGSDETGVILYPSTDAVYYTQRLPLSAAVDIKPNTLNLESKGKWITGYVELPEGYDVGDIDVSTILLNDTVPAELHPTEVGDYDSDGIPDLMVKFSRTDVITLMLNSIDPSEFEYQKPPFFIERELAVTGQLDDGTVFEGSDTLRIIFKYAIII